MNDKEYKGRIIPEAEQREPNKYSDKGFDDVSKYDKKKLDREHDRYLKGLKKLDKDGGNFFDLRPYVQGVIIGIEAEYLSSEDPKEVDKGKEMELLTKKLMFDRKKKTIESKIAASFFGLCTVVGVLFGLNSITGAAIGFASAPSSFLGAILFVGGIAGLFFMRKK